MTRGAFAQAFGEGSNVESPARGAGLRVEGRGERGRDARRDAIVSMLGCGHIVWHGHFRLCGFRFSNRAKKAKAHRQECLCYSSCAAPTGLTRSALAIPVVAYGLCSTGVPGCAALGFSIAQKRQRRTGRNACATQAVPHPRGCGTTCRMTRLRGALFHALLQRMNHSSGGRDCGPFLMARRWEHDDRGARRIETENSGNSSFNMDTRLLGAG
jgi:hypothetical protein